MADGQFLVETKIDSSGVQRGTKEIKQEFTDTAKVAARTAEIMQRELKGVDVDNVADGMSESFGSESAAIKAIMADTAADSRTKAMRIAQEFRAAGMDSSTAMKKAWQIVKSESASGSRKVVDDLDDIGDKAESVGGSISSGIGGAFGKVAGAIGAYLGAQEVYDAGLTLIETAAELQAENAQFTQTFKEFEGVATGSLNAVSKATGIAATRMKKSYSGIYSFSKAIGFETADAFGVTERAMLAIADSAAYFDMSMEDASDHVRSFLKGNYEAGDALNVTATEATRNAKALELYGKEFNDLTEPQKVDALLSMVEATLDLSGATGQAKLEAESWANVTGELEDAWRQFAAVMGEPIKDFVTPILMDATTLLRDLPGLIEEFNLSEALGVDLEPIKTSLGDVVTAAGNLATTLKDSLQPVYEDVLVPLGKWTIEEGLPSTLGAIATALEKNAAAVEWLAPLAPHVIDEYLTPLAEAASEIPVENLNGIAEAFNSLKTALEELDIDAVDLFERFVTATQQIWGLDSPNLFADGIAETGEAADTASGQLDGIGTAAEEANTTGSTAMAALSGAIAGAFASAKDGAVSQLGEIQTAIDGLEGKTVYIDVVAQMLQGGLHGALGNMPSDSSVDPAAYTPSYAYEMPTQIPYLATGAVIPPNAPFMAVLGDQRSGTNLEAPEELIRKIVREETESSIETIVNINWGGSLAGLGRVLQPVIAAETKRKGKNLSEEVAL